MEMNCPPAPGKLAETLAAHLKWCRRALEIVSRENRVLESDQDVCWDQIKLSRKDLLRDLEALVQCVRKQRQIWEQLPAAEKARCSEVTKLLQANSDMVMRIVALDRENEQLLLRRGLLPARHLPAASRQRPHFVADLYRRHAVEPSCP
jgi:hypothetical protein